MRRLTCLFVLVLVLAACGDSSDTDNTDSDEPTPSPTEDVTDEPEPTPTTEDEETPTPEPSPTEPSGEPEEPEDLEEQVDQIAEQVVELRGLELQEELDFAVLSRDELAEVLQDEVDIEPRDNDLYWIFRLIDDRDLNLEQLLVDAQAADVYGFYDPETQETYVISDDDEISILEEVFVAHEIVHALQDQHFSLEPLQTLEPDYDRLLAFRAMVEGDALLFQQLYAQEFLTEDELMEYRQEAMAAAQNEEAREVLEALPRYFVEGLSVPYTAGLQFMMQLYDGGFEGINEALEDPPRSSQQVLNPGEYLEGEIEDPVEIDLPDLTEQLEGDWEEHRSGTFGVLDLRIMLEENGVDESDTVLEPWRGSAFAAYVEDEHVLGVMESRWESEADASAFEDALVETMSGYDEEDGVWVGEDRYHTIVSEEDSVTLYSSTDPDALVDAAGIE